MQTIRVRALVFRQRHRQTDGQTDGQMDVMRSEDRALY